MILSKSDFMIPAWTFSLKLNDLTCSDYFLRVPTYDLRLLDNSTFNLHNFNVQPQLRFYHIQKWKCLSILDTDTSHIQNDHEVVIGNFGKSLVIAKKIYKWRNPCCVKVKVSTTILLYVLALMLNHQKVK